MPLEVVVDSINKKKVSIVSEHGQFAIIEEDLGKNTDQKRPDDKYFFVIITCMFLGLSASIPNSFILTANQYWMYKFRNVSTNVSDGSERTVLQANFSSVGTMVQSIGSVVSMILISFAGHKIRTRTRVYVFFPSLIALFAAHVIFIDLDTDTWQYGFFLVVMVTMAIQTCVNSLCGVAMMTLVSKFPTNCMHYFLLGQGGGDILTPSLSLLSVAVISSFKDAAYMYFIIGIFLLLISGIMFYFATKTEYFKFYYAFLNEGVKKPIHKPAKLWSVLKQMWALPLLGIIAMLAPIHTSITSLVVSEYKGTGSVWGETYFVPVITYVLGAVASTLGRAFSSRTKWAHLVWFDITLSIINTVTLPVLIYFCNAQPRHHLPVYFKKDWEYAIFYLIYRFFGGILQNANMFLTVKLVKNKEDFEAAFAMNVFTSAITGSISSFIAVALVNSL